MLVSPSGVTTSVGGILTLVSSSVFFLLVIMTVPLFMSLSLPLSLCFLLVVLHGGGDTPC